MSENQNTSTANPTVIDANKAIFDKIFKENQELRAKNQELQRTMANFERLARQREEQQRRFDLLEESILNCSGDLVALLSELTQIMTVAFSIPTISIALLDDLRENFSPEISECSDFELERQIPTLTFISEGQYRQLFPSHQPLITAEPEYMLRKLFPKPDRDEILSAAFVPLICRGRGIGLLNMGSPDPEKFLPGTATNAVESLGRKLAIVIENSLLTARLQSLTRVDRLTGLFNQRTLNEILPIEFSRAERYHQPLSLIKVAFENFNEVAANHGQEATDRIAAAIGKLLKTNLRRHDIGFYCGENNFYVLLPSTNYDQGLKVIAKLVRIGRETKVEVAPETKIMIELAAGLAAWPQPGIKTYENLFQAASDLSCGNLKEV
jgi:diguanylate cyclase (GGDEF)-like protein